MPGKPTARRAPPLIRTQHIGRGHMTFDGVAADHRGMARAEFHRQLHARARRRVADVDAPSRGNRATRRLIHLQQPQDGLFQTSMRRGLRLGAQQAGPQQCDASRSRQQCPTSPSGVTSMLCACPSPGRSKRRPSSADHAGLVVTPAIKAREVEVAGPVQRSDDLARLAWRRAPVGLVVFHVRELHHQARMFVVPAFVPITNSMHHLAGVAHDELHGFSLRTWMLSGVKRMLSAMPISMVRFGGLGVSPAMPQSFCSFLTGPAFGMILVAVRHGGG